MNKATVRSIREQLNASVKLDGYTIHFGNASFDGTSCTIKVKVSEGSPAEAERNEWNTLAPMFGLTAEHYGKSVTLGGRSFALVGLNIKARKAPFIGQSPDGKRWKLEEAPVRAALR